MKSVPTKSPQFSSLHVHSSSGNLAKMASYTYLAVIAVLAVLPLYGAGESFITDLVWCFMMV